MYTVGILRALLVLFAFTCTVWGSAIYPAAPVFLLQPDFADEFNNYWTFDGLDGGAGGIIVINTTMQGCGSDGTGIFNWTFTAVNESVAFIRETYFPDPAYNFAGFSIAFQLQNVSNVVIGMEYLNESTWLPSWGVFTDEPSLSFTWRLLSFPIPMGYTFDPFTGVSTRLTIQQTEKPLCSPCSVFLSDVRARYNATVAWQEIVEDFSNDTSLLRWSTYSTPNVSTPFLNISLAANPVGGGESVGFFYANITSQSGGAGFFYLSPSPGWNYATNATLQLYVPSLLGGVPQNVTNLVLGISTTLGVQTTTIAQMSSCVDVWVTVSFNISIPSISPVFGLALSSLDKHSGSIGFFIDNITFSFLQYQWTRVVFDFGASVGVPSAQGWINTPPEAEVGSRPPVPVLFQPSSLGNTAYGNQSFYAVNLTCRPVPQIDGGGYINWEVYIPEDCGNVTSVGYWVYLPGNQGLQNAKWATLVAEIEAPEGVGDWLQLDQPPWPKYDTWTYVTVPIQRAQWWQWTPENFLELGLNLDLSLTGTYVMYMTNVSFFWDMTPLLNDWETVITFQSGQTLATIDPSSTVKPSLSITDQTLCGGSLELTLAWEAGSNGNSFFTLNFVWPQRQANFQLPGYVVTELSFDVTANVTATYSVGILCANGQRWVSAGFSQINEPASLRFPVSEMMNTNGNYSWTADSLNVTEFFLTVQVPTDTFGISYLNNIRVCKGGCEVPPISGARVEIPLQYNSEGTVNTPGEVDPSLRLVPLFASFENESEIFYAIPPTNGYGPVEYLSPNSYRIWLYGPTLAWFATYIGWTTMSATDGTHSMLLMIEEGSNGWLNNFDFEFFSSTDAGATFGTPRDWSGYQGFFVDVLNPTSTFRQFGYAVQWGILDYWAQPSVPLVDMMDKGWYRFYFAFSDLTPQPQNWSSVNRLVVVFAQPTGNDVNGYNWILIDNIQLVKNPQVEVSYEITLFGDISNETFAAALIDFANSYNITIEPGDLNVTSVFFGNAGETSFSFSVYIYDAQWALWEEVVQGLPGHQLLEYDVANVTRLDLPSNPEILWWNTGSSLTASKSVIYILLFSFILSLVSLY